MRSRALFDLRLYHLILLECHDYAHGPYTMVTIQVRRFSNSNLHPHHCYASHPTLSLCGPKASESRRLAFLRFPVVGPVMTPFVCWVDMAAAVLWSYRAALADICVSRRAAVVSVSRRRLGGARSM